MVVVYLLQPLEFVVLVVETILDQMSDSVDLVRASDARPWADSRDVMFSRWPELPVDFWPSPVWWKRDATKDSVNLALILEALIRRE